MKIKATVAYNGFRYCGWQVQDNAVSIQEIIEKTLGKITKTSRVEIFASGRTDAGVHALGQVFHFDTDITMNENNWEQAMNSLLPEDMRIQKIEFVADDFHARYSVKGKRYRYLLNQGKADPFHYQTIYQYGRILNIEQMKEAAKVFIGEHDFSTFSATKKEIVPNQVKNIHEIIFSETDGILAIEFVGTGFLRYMVRMLMGTLIQVGEGKLTKEEVKHMLEAKNREVRTVTAPACGLTLVEVEYK